MKRTAVVNVVGLSSRLIGEHTPRIREFAQRGAKATITPVFPAVTCSAQSTYLTGLMPSAHGIVGNGWYNRELAEVQFWKQSNHLVQGRKIWEEIRESRADFTCAKLFWWFNMYSSADYSITPRPSYPADGRKVFDVYSGPPGIRQDIKQDLGDFPFPTFWGPAAGVKTPQGEPDAATKWIAAAAKWIEQKYAPSLNLVYLPHLDYNLQRLGSLHPDTTQDLRAVDAIVGGLIDFFDERSVQVVLLSEYGITPVQKPIYINRILRENHFLTIKSELGLELLDCGASRAFAVADHQVAHIYLKNNSAKERALVSDILREDAGIALVLDEKEKSALGIDHPRAGDLIAVAKEDAWFAYYYWFDDAVAPDFARCVDIHRKPGYDPAELFLDPKLTAPKLKILWRLMKKRMGFRMLMDVIPLDATLVKGSHGCIPESKEDHPVLITQRAELLSNSELAATDVYQVLRRHLK